METKESVKDRTIQFVKYLGITMKAFEIKCNLSSGYVTSMRKGFGSEKLNNVLNAFPELNREWLLYGEGPMLLTDGGSVDHSAIAGRDATVSVTDSRIVERFLDEISEQRRLVEKSQCQVDRLLGIIERMQGGGGGEKE